MEYNISMDFIINDDAKSNVVLPGSKFGKELGFTSDKFEGYLWRNGNTEIVIPLIESLHPGKGNFTNLAKTLMDRYQVIYIPVVSNKMKSVATKLGFKFAMIKLDDELIPDSCVWRKDGNYEEYK